MQSAALRAELGGNHTFQCLEGVIRVPPAPEIATYLTGKDECFTYFDYGSQDSISKALEDLGRYIVEEGPFDGIMAFSHGASLASMFSPLPGSNPMSYLQVRHFPIRVNVAYHSPLMAPIASKYMNAIGDMKDKTIPLCSQFKPKMISSVTGGEVNAKELRLGSYWVKNMLAPVKFLQAMNRLCQVQCKPLHKIDGSHRSILSTNTLIEIGPHSALQGPICEIISKAGADWIEYYSVLKRDRSTIDSILDTAGRLYCRGFSKLNFTSLNRPGNTSLVSCLTDLPEYEFNHSRDYWWESRISKQYRLYGSSRLDLLGKQTPDWVPHAPR
ncbi:hypothetical protein EAE99_003869 [Botrytis elliptica]|nr:hypothetical protein EAE99_003869 [Botrytis elliptica]